MDQKVKMNVAIVTWLLSLQLHYSLHNLNSKRLNFIKIIKFRNESCFFYYIRLQNVNILAKLGSTIYPRTVLRCWDSPDKGSIGRFYGFFFLKIKWTNLCQSLWQFCLRLLIRGQSRLQLRFDSFGLCVVLLFAFLDQSLDQRFHVDAEAGGAEVWIAT